MSIHPLPTAPPERAVVPDTFRAQRSFHMISFWLREFHTENHSSNGSMPTDNMSQKSSAPTQQDWSAAIRRFSSNQTEKSSQPVGHIPILNIFSIRRLISSSTVTIPT